MNKQIKMGAILSYFNIISKNIVNFMYTPFLLRYVGQANYGLFQMTNSVILSLSLLSMGFSSAYVKFYMMYKVNKDEESIQKLNGIYSLLFVGISLLSLIIGSILVINTGNIFGGNLTATQVNLMRKLMIIMVLDVAITFISTIFDSNITVNEQFIFQQSRQLIQTFLVPLICIPMVLMGTGVLSIVITQISVTTIFLVLNINYCFRRLGMRFKFKDLPVSLLKGLLSFSFFIFLNQIVDLINNNAPNFILGIFQGAKLVATFSIAVQIKNMFFMLSTSLSGMFIPKINKLVSLKRSNSELTDLMIKVGRIQMSLLFFVLGGFIVVGRYFIQLWAGNQNSDAYGLIILMVLPSIVPLSQNVGIEVQKAMNKHIFRSVTYFIFAIVNVLITTIGAIYWGLYWAAMGYVTSIVFANGILMNWYYYRYIGLDMKRYWKKTCTVMIPFIITTGSLGILQELYPVANIGTFFLFGCIYAGIYGIIYFKYVANQYEKQILRSLKK